MTISVEQRLTALAKLGEHINWNSLTVEQVQVGITEAPRAGAEATIFIRNGFRVQVGDYFRETGEFTLTIPALPQPTLTDLRVKFPDLMGEKGAIERDISPIEAVTLRLGTVLGPDDGDFITGQEYERRLVLVTGLFGYQQLQWLVDHQDEHPAFKALLGQIYIDGPGLIVVSGDGYRFFPYLGRGGERWFMCWGRCGDGFRRNGRVAAAGK